MPRAGEVSPYLTLPANGERKGSAERVAPNRKERKVATSASTDEKEKRQQRFRGGGDEGHKLARRNGPAVQETVCKSCRSWKMP